MSHQRRRSEVRKLLRTFGNVLLTALPPLGKSRLLNEVGTLFGGGLTPAYTPGAAVPFPAGKHVAAINEWLPSPDCTKRDVQETAFHPGSKYRDLLRGLSPAISPDTGFVVSDGILYKTALFATQADSAALLIVDEINRGPAVQIFGDAIVALDLDKRLDADRKHSVTTQTFQLLQDDGTIAPFAFPADLYILAAMNKADTSVEPLDVAFLRRWSEFHVDPNEAVLRNLFDLAEADFELPDKATTAKHVYAATVSAWRKVNDRIALGRGADFQLGHGIFFQPGGAPPDDVGEAETYVQEPWKKLRTHLDEVSFRQRSWRCGDAKC